MVQGDKNTAFYHVSTLVRRKINTIMAIKNGVRKCLYEELDIMEFIRKGFNDIYTSSLNSLVKDFQAILNGRLDSRKRKKKVWGLR